MNNENYVSIDNVAILTDWIMQDLIIFMSKKYNIQSLVNIDDLIIEFKNENIERFKGVSYV